MDMLEQSSRLWYNDPQKAYDIANKIYLTAVKSADEKLEARALYCLGVCCEIMGNFPQATKYLSEAINISNRIDDKKTLADSLNCIGIINDNISNYSKALRAYFKALKIYEELDNKRNISIVLSNIGLIYTNINDYRNALKFYSRALEIAEDEQDDESILVTTINIGLTHYLLNNYSDALKFLEEALKLSEKKNDNLRLSITMDHIADVKIQLGEYEEAYTILEKSAAIKEQIHDRKGLVKIFGTIGKLNIIGGKYETAVQHLQDALVLAENLGMKRSVYELNRLLSEAYEKNKDINNALIHLKKAYEKEIEHLKEQSEKKARNIETQLEIEQAQKEAEIQRLKNVELAKALEEVKELNVQLQELNQEKNEFMGIAVHDLKNPLQNILSSARILKKNYPVDEPTRIHLTDNIIHQTDRMFNLISKLLNYRAIEEGKIPINTTEVDIVKLTEEVISEFSADLERKNLSIVKNIPAEEIIASADRDILHQIIQNLLSNAIKFSPHGKNIFINISISDNRKILSIKDEGPGFTESDKTKLFKKFARLSAKPTGYENSTGLGLSIVKKLCEMIGAEIELDSSTKNGAKFILILN
jgi:signal transduction histidine kinase/Tfp pilus assembly protein PilF